MVFLKSFTLPTLKEEEDHARRFWPNGNDHPAAYPYGIFPYKQLRRIECAEVTILCGGNGSGKTTLLNLIAVKLGLPRITPFNRSPHFDEYVRLMCEAESSHTHGLAPGSAIYTSDDVFYGLIDRRVTNEETDTRREAAQAAYYAERRKDYAGDQAYRSLDDYDALVRRVEVRHKTMSRYVSAHAGELATPDSNGQYALRFFEDHFSDGALILLDEPENSLSPKYQLRLLKLIEDYARFYDCQFILSTHSPFFMSMKGAALYDLDEIPVSRRAWWELESMQEYYRLFSSFRDKFE